MATNSKQFHNKFITWAIEQGEIDFTRSHNINGRDTYENESVQLAWRLWQDVADKSILIEEDL